MTHSQSVLLINLIPSGLLSKISLNPSFLVASRECHLLSMLCDFGSDSPTAIPEAIPPDIIFQLSDSFFFACGILLVLSYII